MMRASTLLTLAALAISSLALATGCSSSDSGTAVADDDLTSALGTGTYVVDSRPFGSYYAARITLSAGKKYEAEMVSSSGDKSILGGSYDILPARPNNPQSPVLSDKPTLFLNSDSGGAGVSFEFDKLPNGGLKLYHTVRTVSFTLKKDPTWQPAPTNTKTISCTGPAVDAKLTLDQAQNQRGTLVLKRKAGADHNDPPSVTVPMTKTPGSEVPEYVYFEGSKGEQDYYVNIIKKDFERGTGDVTMYLHWAQGGQEWSIGAKCAYER